MEKPPIWNDAIEGEKRNPQDPAVYGGAWYHKVVSSKDKWVGIEATVTLPAFKIERYEGEYDASLPSIRRPRISTTPRCISAATHRASPTSASRCPASSSTWRSKR